MSANIIFVDSNVILYVFSDDEEKKKIALSLLNSSSIISTQVVNENVSICLKKFKLSKEDAFKHGANLLNTCTVVVQNNSTLLLAYKISEQYKFGIWDSLIIATALENNCDTLLSEDMQNGLLIEDRLKIVNPFV